MNTPDPSNNPYLSPGTSGIEKPIESADLTTVDWLICIFCSGIGCILGIVRMTQGKPNGGKMIAISIVFAIIWGVLRAILETAMQNQ